MNHEDLINFRDNVALPRVKELFDNTQIPEGACYIDKVQLSFLDGRSCGTESHFQAFGISFEGGEPCVYHFDDTDLTASEFFEAHKDCFFVSDGSLAIKDDLEDLDLNTVLRNIKTSGKLFYQMENLPEITVVANPIPYYKLKYLMENGPEIESRVNMDTDGLAVDGHRGTWHTIDHADVDGVTCYLMEHDEYGDEAACIIVDPSGKLLLEDVYDGLDEETLDNVRHELLTNKLFDKVQQQLDNKFSLTSYGEPEAFVMLDNGRSIRITFEQYGLSEEEQYYSGMLNCNAVEQNGLSEKFPLGFVDTVDAENASPEGLRSLISSLLLGNELNPAPVIDKKKPLVEQIQAAAGKAPANPHTNTPPKAPDR